MNRRTNPFAGRVLEVKLVLLTACVLALNLPYLRSSFVGAHDTLAAFQHFHFAYSEWFYNEQIPRWIPYGAFGVSGEFKNLMVFSPAMYLAGLIGRLFGVQDALLLFKCSIIGEQVIFLSGLYLLCGGIFKGRSTVWLVCLAAIGSTVWHSQVFLNWRIYYLFPMVLYLVTSFLSGGRPERFWLAGIATTAWALGSMYFATVWIFVFAVLLLALMRHHGSAWRRLLARSWRNVAAFIGFVLVAGIYAYVLWGTASALNLHTPGRDAATGMPDLAAFLTYGGRAEPLKVLQSALLGWPIHLPWGAGVDNSVYVGLLPLVFFVWGLFHVKEPVFIAVAVAAGCLVWLSLGGLFAATVYYVPPLMFFRHIGLVYGLVKILVVIGAGFGWESFWRSTRRAGPLLIIVACFALLVDMATNLPDRLLGNVYNPGAWPLVFGCRAVAYGGLVALVAVLSRLRLGKWLAEKMGGHADHADRLMKAAVVFGLLLDVSAFQCLVHRFAPEPPAAYQPLLDAVSVRKPTYLERRTVQPQSGRQRDAVQLSTYPGSGAHYVMIYSFAQFDPYMPEFRADNYAPGIDRLRETLKGNDSRLPVILGRDCPKARLVGRAVFAENREDACRKVAELDDPKQVVVIRRGGPGEGAHEKSGGEGGSGTVKVVRFSANEVEMEAAITGDSGAWLVYADAARPGWRAFVNGEEAGIAEAYMVFKAVWLERGNSQIRLTFHAGLVSILGQVLALFGVCFALGMTGWFFLLCFHVSPDKQVRKE